MTGLLTPTLDYGRSLWRVIATAVSRCFAGVVSSACAEMGVTQTYWN